jgi:hypothetical protein
MIKMAISIKCRQINMTMITIKCCFLQFCLKPRNRIYLPFLLSRASHTSILPCSAAKCNALRPSWSNTSTRPLLSKKIYSEYKNITHYLSYLVLFLFLMEQVVGNLGNGGVKLLLPVVMYLRKSIQNVRISVLDIYYVFILCNNID